MSTQATTAQPKKRNKRRYGVKIKNPLSLPVSVILRSETGAICGQQLGRKETTRQIDPGQEIFVPTKGCCELDVDIAIIRYDPDGRKRNAGKGDFKCVDHRDPRSGKRKSVTDPDGPIPELRRQAPEEPKPEPAEEEEVEIRSLGDMLKDRAEEEVPA